MPFRLNLIDPEGLSLMSEAFDKAWLAINASTRLRCFFSLMRAITLATASSGYGRAEKGQRCPIKP
jgi:hypothetical protein